MLRARGKGHVSVIENLREKYELCKAAQHYALDFKEFALLLPHNGGAKTFPCL